MPNGDVQVEFQSPTTGKVQVVPQEHWEEALKQGYKPASHKVMYSPEGKRGMVANADVTGKMKEGYQTTPKTSFEKARPGKGISLEGAGTAAWEALKGMVPGGPSSGKIPEWRGKWALPEPIEEAGSEAKAGWMRAGGDVRAKIGEAVPSAIGSFFGFSGKRAAEHAERGEGGAIIGEAAVPAGIAAASYVLPKAVPKAAKAFGETKMGRVLKAATKSKAELLSEEHTAVTREAELKYQRDLAVHKENVQAIKAEHSKAVTEFKSAEELKGHQQKLAGAVSENLKLADKRIAEKIGGKFEKVADAVEKKNPKIEITDAEREARSKLFFPDSVQAFNNIMENFKSKLGMTDFSILRKTYTRMNEVLYGGRDLPTDLYQAVKTVRDSLGRDLQKAATKAGQGESFRQAMRDWSNYQNDWHDTTAAAKGGSQISKILQAEDPQFVIDQLAGKTGERLVNTLKDYGKYGADSGLAARLRSLTERMKSAPKVKAPEIPKIPSAPKPPEIAPFDEEATREMLAAQRLRKLIGTGLLGAGGAYAYEKLLGQGGQGGRTAVP